MGYPTVIGRFSFQIASFMQTFGVSLLSAWTNCWTNSRVVTDLRHHGAHVTVTVMHQIIFGLLPNLHIQWGLALGTNISENLIEIQMW